MNSNIVLHAGGWTASEDQVNEVPLPERTKTYTPVPHGRVIDLLRELIPTRGMAIHAEKFALAAQGQRMFGVMDITNGTGRPDWGLALGMRNSYDKSMVLGLAGGSRVFVCDNLAFTSDIVLNRRHVGSVDQDLRSLIGSLLDAFVTSKEEIAARIERMKDITLTDVNAHDIVCRTIREGVLPPSQAAKVLEEWYTPRHEAFEPRTQWSLYNAYTEVSKERTPALQMSSTVGLTNLMRQWAEEVA